MQMTSCTYILPWSLPFDPASCPLSFSWLRYASTTLCANSVFDKFLMCGLASQLLSLMYLNCATVVPSLPKYAMWHLRHMRSVIIGPSLCLCTFSLVANTLFSHRLQSQPCIKLWIALSVLRGTGCGETQTNELHHTFLDRFLRFRYRRQLLGQSFFHRLALCSSSRMSFSFHVACLARLFVRGIVHPSFFFLLPLPTSYFLPLLLLLLLLLCCSHLCLELRRLVPCVGPASLNWLPSCPLTSWVLSVQHCQSMVPTPRVPTRFVPLSAQCIAVFGRANHWSPVPLRGNVRLCCVVAIFA